MSRGKKSAASANKLLNDRYRKSRALHRVSTRTKLVEKHQRFGISLVQNLHNTADMGGKSGKVIFNALAVADIHKDILKDRHPAAVSRRNEKSAHSHCSEESGSL